MHCEIARSERFFCPSRFCRFLMLFLLLCSAAVAQTWTQNPALGDEFNGTSVNGINAAIWQFDKGILNVNNEAEFYCAPTDTTNGCDPTNPNAFIDGSGHLVIQAIRINSGVAPYSGSWTSARLNTGNNLQNFQYGRIEASMKLPIGPGLWPAFWALGNNITTVSWPMSGEMDFMENVPAASGLGPNTIKSTLHGGNSSISCYCGGNGMGLNYSFPGGDPNGPDVTTFHTYGAIWSPNMVQFYVDDPTHIFFVRTSNDVPPGQTWDFNHPFFVLLNLAVGGMGSWPGAPDNTTPSPAQMVVDYVRAYTPSTVAGPTMSGTSISVKAGSPGTSALSLNSTAGTGRVYLSCTTTAPKATCSINSSDTLNPFTVDFSNSATGSATVSVTTATNASAAALSLRRFGQWAVMVGSLFGGLTLLIPSRRRRSVAIFGVMMVLAIMTSCGGGSSSSGGGGGSNGTPPGNYAVTVTAYTVSNSGGTPDTTASIPMTVN
jgi:beta-glucanase (GH16 family)